MNFAVIGLGSMGKRRIRLLNKYIETYHDLDSKWNIIGIDIQKERREECSLLFGIETYHSIQNAIDSHKIDAVIISTAPLSHGVLIQQCLQVGMHVFSEINLVNDYYDDNLEVARLRNKVLFLSSTFMYRKEIQYIKDLIKKKEEPGIYRYHVGQYLPLWHPWELYMDFFVGDKRTNACRELFAIELPWILDIFGSVRSVISKHKKVSKLKVEYDDSYQVVIEHEDGTLGSITVDVVTPITERRFEYWSENEYISWGGHPDRLEIYNDRLQKLEKINLYDSIEHKEGYEKFIVENAYYDELVEFIEVIEKGTTPRYSFEKDYQIIELIDQIEK